MTRRRSSAPPSPLPQCDGVDAVRVRLPGEGGWGTVGEYLGARLRGAGDGVVEGLFARGRVVGVDGRAVAGDAPFVPGAYVWFHRDLAPEVPVPFGLDVVYRDAHILVADKPHFLATTPRGSHVTQTALARLRRELGVPALSPAHRLDRLTAGLVLFTVRPEERGAYQTLFRDRKVRKVYEAVAPHDPARTFPLTLTSRMEKHRGSLTAVELPGTPNAVTHVTRLAHRGTRALYRLTPETGQTHQLRVHMASLNLPLLGDPLYPEVLPPIPPTDFHRPLQLLARELHFTDPLTGREHHLRSARTLEAWEAYDEWAGRPA
ncbi:pseudouridylate synthase [Streptomyces roseirectus]|uniref:RNA pseudouridylate synthase n=1 Tax=Streptomyces roseirectus TaxID=2768066 RepID=A0A7H0ILN5_9ACTN|nr:pseudouridine synthase [Streptomyces roseirectus]QNP73701.1 pseudouridylate synthase [Streptomyces roseirectus]